ncbi:MAG TPA: YihY/virulence factor BrkB family protein [Solirubrobacterales bacterium]|nr:YihY/virulence factor BrkB family protein [Solirubrobacterales bacterium]
MRPEDGAIPLSEQWKHFPWLQAFWTRAYRENITGLSGMVAYNLMLAIFPFVFLVLFIFSQVLRIKGVETGIFNDLQRLFPDAEQNTLDNIISTIRSNSATLGVVAAIGSLWIGASFWGAMDTAFCRIYHVECRGWWEQKRFSLGMLLVVALFLLGSVVLPAAEGALIRQTENLPFGLNEIQNLDSAVLIAVTLTLNFIVGAVIYWAVPKGHMPWRAVWPGALFTTIVAGLANWLFPVYLSNVSTLDRFGSTIGFILIALLWFYLVALTMLAGAVINSLRHEYHDTGRLPYGIVSRASLLAEALARKDETDPPPMAEPYRSLTARSERDESAEPAEPETAELPDVIPLDSRRRRR